MPGAAHAGYAALIADHALLVPLPDSLCAISARRRKYEQGRWRLFTPRHQPDETLQGQLTFALKYEGIDLAVLKALFEKIAPEAIVAMVRSAPTGLQPADMVPV